MKYKLDDINKKSGFKVPEGYFEDLPMKIQQRIGTESTPQTIRLPSWSLAMAASFIIILTAVFILKNTSTPTAEELLAEVSQEELVAYLDLIELDEYDIASAVDENSEILNFEETDVLDGIDMDEGVIDDVLLEYDLADEYL
ncbi:MAG: hypothetical protein RLN88_03820 [Ekhidna sp.]|uniref:hypothetical protein n=1 Tax=Ekhidna sp. TaxID=2608089 RepID=UPI0032F03B50